MASQPPRPQPSAESPTEGSDDDDFDYALPQAAGLRPTNAGTADPYTELCGFPESVLKRLHEHIGLSCCQFQDVVATALSVSTGSFRPNQTMRVRVRHCLPNKPLLQGDHASITRRARRGDA
uniref:Uncharacterized protein n=1 Tax=Neobodo designis TaxID=312471 RepID=A0A7S1LBN1_NEODS|mmetsp:Transcript_19005/g.58980  ORF Transcript_19005/g.58980 Transcript_19005/m.58980 type:complete len:122 (+) Transcript_19005:28-393(+)